MPIIPDFLLTHLSAYLPAILTWVSDLLYAELLRHTPDHFLVHLHRQLDCTPLEAACAAFHHASGPGAPPSHSVPHLVRALLVGYLFDWSLRQLEWQIRFNLLVKWFVGYRLADLGPDHSTLARFHQWVSENQQRTFFDETLRQIDAQFPAERGPAQVGDTFAMQANATRESLIRLLRHTSQRLLSTLKRTPAYAIILPQLDLPALFGPADEPNEYYLDKLAYQQRLAAVASAAHHCARLVEEQLAQLTAGSAAQRQAVQEWLAYLHKVLADELALTIADSGHISAVAPLPAAQQGAYRLGSATDPEATYRFHGPGKCDFGYNVNLAVSPHFIREIQAATGAQPDCVSLVDLLLAQKEHHGFLPAKFIYDAAAGSGKTMADVQTATKGQTQLVAPLNSNTKRSPRFGPDAFTPAADGTSLRCPNGQESNRASRTVTADGAVFRFSARQCQGCAHWQQCRAPQAGPASVRHVFISDYRDVLAAARAYQQTAAYKADRKCRPLVERFIAVLTRYTGARRACRIGLLAADFQAKMCALACNLKQWVRLLARQERARA